MQVSIEIDQNHACTDFFVRIVHSILVSSLVPKAKIRDRLEKKDVFSTVHYFSKN